MQNTAVIRSSDHVSCLYRILGPDAVLLPLAPKSKSPTVRAWQTLTLADTQTPAYQERLRQGNIGVSLGEPSNGLCSIDCDSDESLEQFLTLNTELRKTLITAAMRGGNVWVKIIGPYPRLKTFKGFGEWRSTGGQTVIWGVHPDGPRYRFVNEAPVVTMAFGNIKWPEEVSFERKRAAHPPSNHSSVSPVSESASYIPVSESCIPASLHNNGFKEVVSRIEKLAEIEERQVRWLRDEKNKRIAPLYRDLVLRSAMADVGQRNAAVVALGKRLFYAVSPPIALDLLMGFYEINAPLFNDPADQHRRESEHMLANVEGAYLDELSDGEREVYAKLPDRLRPPFRIFRDLARRPDPRNKPGEFFMSADGLGRRLGLSCVEADRVLKQFVKALGLLTVVAPGERRGAGKTPIATLYRWLLPLVLPPAPIAQEISPSPADDPFAATDAGEVSPEELAAVDQVFAQADWGE